MKKNLPSVKSLIFTGRISEPTVIFETKLLSVVDVNIVSLFGISVVTFVSGATERDSTGSWVTDITDWVVSEKFKAVEIDENVKEDVEGSGVVTTDGIDGDDKLSKGVIGETLGNRTQPSRVVIGIQSEAVSFNKLSDFT